jgi:acyl-CoA synthetase (NDP forming)
MDARLKKSLDRIFFPASVTIAGVSTRMDSPGTLFLRSLKDMDFAGEIYPVNPRHDEILGYKCYPDITSVPACPDLAILAVPPAAVPELVRECAACDAGGCIINTAGFSETSREEGKALERDIVDGLRGSDLRLVGPNCMGIYSSRGRIALFTGMFPSEGRASMISQSGSLSSITFMTGLERGILFDKIVSSGNELDLNCSDYLEYYANDPRTHMILAYLEQIRDARRFLDTAKEIKGIKPLILMKAGLTGSGRKAAASHTGALAGNTEILEGAAHQAGIILVEDLGEMLDAAAALYHLPECHGRRVAIISSPGGIAVNTADAAEKSGLELSVLSEKTRTALSDFLPHEGTSFSNPVDLGFGGIVPGNYARTLEILDRDPTVDIMMAIGSAPASRDGDIGLLSAITEEVLAAKEKMKKPIVVVIFPSAFVSPYLAKLHGAAVPAYVTPTAACSALNHYCNFHGCPAAGQ